MSTRWYPIYQRGNPQLRVFLPNFWMKLVRPLPQQASNIVHFQCSMEMTKHDIKNYLDKIYNVPIIDIRTKITTGRFRKDAGKGYIVKDDDIKYAMVVLPKTMTFEFPNIFEKKKGDLEDDTKSLEETKKSFRKYINRNKDRPDVPSWFSI
ncbi:probable 39S ribosomal protein L23, mitochondrial [Leptidea sinapis]|uniref:Large ribosomal subunit protein uL23m n=1 Tax=Leptidea sinapis TaxID=189913 RepID=A0A5E4QGM4_9NEOP|nr:probable 39S ribosomal protein L23, mitochondrial [Leptidea sinapis]VVC96966.1 unnamed protein product [Leptidea sinapis]